MRRRSILRCTLSAAMPESDREGRLPLHYAAADGNLVEAEARLAAGDAPNLADRAGWTPLHFAAQAGSHEVARLLLDRGAEVDPLNMHGNSPLHLAVSSSKGHGELISLLRQRGADPFKTAKGGKSAVEYARMIGNYDVGQFFVDLPAGQPPQKPPQSGEGSPKPKGLVKKLTEAETLWRDYVPKRGQADTVQGELMRAVEKLRDEAQRNGNQNWAEGHVILAEFLRDTLLGSSLFDPATVAEINRYAARLLDFDHPETSDEPFDGLTERIVEWSRAHPEPIAREHNPHLHV
jgi:uncharacterized protein